MSFLTCPGMYSSNGIAVHDNVIHYNGCECREKWPRVRTSAQGAFSVVAQRQASMREARSRSACSRGDSPSAESFAGPPQLPREGVGTSRSSAGDRCMSRGLGASNGDAVHATANGVCRLGRSDAPRAAAIANGLKRGTCTCTTESPLSTVCAAVQFSMI